MSSDQTKPILDLLSNKHKLGLRGLLSLYPYKHYRDILLAPLVLSVVIYLVLFLSDADFELVVESLISTAVSIIPSMIGFLLGGMAILLGLGDRKFFATLTYDIKKLKDHLDNNTYPEIALFQKVYFGFTITLLIQIFTLSIAWVFDIFSQVYIPEIASYYSILNITGTFILLFLIFTTMLSLYQVVIVIFNLSQSYNLNLFLSKLGNSNESDQNQETK